MSAFNKKRDKLRKLSLAIEAVDMDSLASTREDLPPEPQVEARVAVGEIGPPTFNYEQTVKGLNKWYNMVKSQILRYQSPTSGLFPCDGEGANEKVAYIRDSIYCAVSVWALAQAYKRIDDDKGRTHELAQSAVKCMRGILKCWIRQADKVETFKRHQSAENALHSKFHLHTGDTITSDDEYGHLQIDCIALYLIFLVQMINSGLQIIFTTDEVNFIQNLAFYVERAYRTPDYGMWERGSKYNNGSIELHASSIGMVKAALETINGENLFGENGASWSVIYVDIDAHNRNRTIFDTILPRESNSKNTDASLLPTVSWPTFAVHEERLVNRTKDKICRKLRGRYGFKRFLRDGYGTLKEDTNRKFYLPSEVKDFEGIECEWPLFIIYMIIDGVFKGDVEQIATYQNMLKPLLLKTDEGVVVPKYYLVPWDKMDKEREQPGSCRRVANNEDDPSNIFLWGQSIYIISQLLVEGLLSKVELDPIGRNLPAASRPRPNTRYSSFQSSPSDLVIQVVLIAETIHLQQMLATYGIQTQTPHQIEPIQIWPPSELMRAYGQLGVNNKLKLSGRPRRPIGGLGTAKIYRACGITFLCYPLVFEVSEFYLAQDMQLLIDDIKSDLAFLGKCWKLAGRPTFCMIIREENMRGPNTRYLFDLLAHFKRGECDGTKIRLGRLQEFLASSCIEHLDFLKLESDDGLDFNMFQEKESSKQFRSLTDIPRISSFGSVQNWVDEQEIMHKNNWELIQLYNATDNMYCRSQVLRLLKNREGKHFYFEGLTVEDRLEELLRESGTNQSWAVVRFCASLLEKVIDSLAPSVTAILVRGKQMTIGIFGKEEAIIDKPLTPDEIKKILYTKCYLYDNSQTVLQQELIINIGKFISTNPKLFDGCLTIRMGWIVHAMQVELGFMAGTDSASHLQSLSPSAIKKLLFQVLSTHLPEGKERSVVWKRHLDGSLNRVPPDFYDRVWQILQRTPGGLKVASFIIPQQPTLSDMTQYELNFSLLVEEMLGKIAHPAYRQIVVESFMVVSTVLERNSELSFQKTMDMDKIVDEAFSLFQIDRSRLEGEEKSDNKVQFYSTPPNVQHGTTSYIAKAVVNQLLDGEVNMLEHAQCCVS